MAMALPLALTLLVVTALVVVKRRLLAAPVEAPTWAAARGLVLTPTTAPMVEHYLRTARHLRRLGGLAGALLPIPVAAALGRDIGAFPRHWVWVFVGYLAGALYAEVVLGRPLVEGPRRASLVPRELGDYIPQRLVLVQRGAGAVALILGVVPAAAGFDRAGDDGMPHLSMAGAVALGAVGLTIAWPVRRPGVAA